MYACSSRRSTYTYLDLFSKEVLYLHRELAEYVVRDETSFASLRRMLHARKAMHNTAVIQVVPQHAMLIKDSENPQQHRETLKAAFAEGVSWDAPPEKSSNRLVQLEADLGRLCEVQRLIQHKLKQTARGTLRRMTREVAALIVQRAYVRRLQRSKRSQISSLNFRYDSIRERLRACVGRPALMYYYVPENLTNPHVKRGWHWVETEEQFEVFFMLLQEKAVEDASLLRKHLDASTFHQVLAISEFARVVCVCKRSQLRLRNRTLTSYVCIA